MQSVCQLLDDHVSITCHFVLGILYRAFHNHNHAIKKKLPRVAILVVWSARHMEMACRISHTLFLQRNNLLCLLASEEIFFFNFSQSAKLDMTPLLFCPIAMKSYNGSFCKSERLRRRRFLEIDKVETTIVYSGHVCQLIGTKLPTCIPPIHIGLLHIMTYTSKLTMMSG